MEILKKEVEQFYEIDFIANITKKLLKKNEQKFVKICKEFFKYVNGKKYNEELYKKTYKYYNCNDDKEKNFEKLKKYYFSQKNGFIDDYVMIGNEIFKGKNHHSSKVLSKGTISIIAYCYTYKLDFPKVFYKNSKDKLIKDERDSCEVLRFGEKTQYIDGLYFNGEIFYHIKKNKNMYKNIKKDKYQFHKLNREFTTYRNQYDVVDDNGASEIIEQLEIQAFERTKEDEEDEEYEEDHTESFQIAEEEFFEDYVPHFISNVCDFVYPKMIHLIDDLKHIHFMNNDSHILIKKNKENLKYFQEKDIECCICLEKKYELDYIKTNCSHFFHKKCMINIDKCPLCRREKEYENCEIIQLNWEYLYNPITKYYDQ